MFYNKKVALKFVKNVYQKISVMGPTVSSIFRNLEARTDNGELLNLIDGQGCPLNELIYPALALESKTRALFANFKVNIFHGNFGITRPEYAVMVKPRLDFVICLVLGGNFYVV